MPRVSRFVCIEYVKFTPARTKYVWQRLINTVTRQPPGRIRQTLPMYPGGEFAECVVKKCLTSLFELFGYPFGTILKSDARTFQSASIWPSPIKDCVGRMGKNNGVGCKHTMDMFFLEKMPPTRLHHTEVGIGMQPQLVFTRIQISRNQDIQMSSHPDNQIPYSCAYSKVCPIRPGGGFLANCSEAIRRPPGASSV